MVEALFLSKVFLLGLVVLSLVAVVVLVLLLFLELTVDYLIFRANDNTQTINIRSKDTLE